MRLETDVSDNYMALPLRGRAVVNGAGQAVSALRASVAIAVKVITQREVIRSVPKAWEAAYSIGYYAKDQEKQAITDKLRSLDVDTCSADDVAAIIGNRSWVENDCDLCADSECDIILQIGDEPDYDSRWMNACLPCAANLGKLAAQAIEARRAETQVGSVHESAVPEGDAS